MPQFDLTDAHKEIGKQLHKIRIVAGKIRIVAGKSLNQAAIGAGIAPRTLSKIEDGESNFRKLTLEKLLKAYNTDLSHLLRDFILPPPAAKQCSARKI